MKRRSFILLVLSMVLTLAGAVASAMAQSCQWTAEFNSPVGLDGYTSALTVYDDGRGPALYAGGGFNRALFPGGYFYPVSSNIAKWDGRLWSEVGNGTDRRVSALAVYDDGNGPALYAGGEFTRAGTVAADYIAMWDGTFWTGLSGMNGRVSALTVYDDGNGPALYAGGQGKRILILFPEQYLQEIRVTPTRFEPLAFDPHLGGLFLLEQV